MSTELIAIDTQVEFEPWAKIPRAVLGGCIISMKMNGTNACIIIKDGKVVGVQSRKRMINIGKENDNYGFASYVAQNMEKVLQLGEGRHYGEWAGLGIQKNPHNLESKTFFLFDTRRWGEHNVPPEGIEVVEILHQGEYSRTIIDDVMNTLKTRSETEGWKAEGIVVYLPKIKAMEKHTFEYSKGKWAGK